MGENCSKLLKNVEFLGILRIDENFEKKSKNQIRKHFHNCLQTLIGEQNPIRVLFTHNNIYSL